MNIYLIRHTTPNIDLVYAYGQSDLDVKETFPKEVERIKAVLPAFKSATIVSSPLQRCAKLAQALEIGDVEFDDRLKEINFGDWEMVRWSAINKEKFDYWLADFVNRRAPGGESYKDMYERMNDFLDEKLKSKAKDIVIVSHGGAIRTILARVVEMPLKNLFHINLDFGGVAKLEFTENKLKIDYINK